MQSSGRRLFQRAASQASRCICTPNISPSWQVTRTGLRWLSTESGAKPSQAHEAFRPNDAVLGAGRNETESLHSAASDGAIRSTRRAVPVTCPGCGALSQQTDKSWPGHYTRTRKTVKEWLKGRDEQTDTGNDPYSSIVAEADNTVAPTVQSTPVPFCDRCHELVHDNKGTPIDHPSIEDIADSIAESPYKQNHVYHVLDAADFPMSLVPAIHSALELAKPRSRNRRSQHNYTSRPTMSFVITRSDLLAPTKEKVDRLLPYFREILRDRLSRTRKNMRLGDLHLVSAKRGWWTKELKDEIWNRGGGNWLVGKFNVGKSNLFEVIFPKGSGDRAPVYKQLVEEQSGDAGSALIPDFLPESQLLPPPQPEVPFPTLPLVSSLPGTTASPIRLPFGNKKGELIDMPGLERSNLADYVKEEHKQDLVMEGRPKIEQHTIKSGQSLLLGGGIVRITPLIEDRRTNVLAYPFVPLKAHVTSTEKASGTQQQERDSGIETILSEDVGSRFKSAGIFTLNTDVTKKHAGAVVRAGVDVSKLPFRIYATDILIQGVGWVEVVCQVRRTRREPPAPPQASTGLQDLEAASDTDSGTQVQSFQPLGQQFEMPKIEVFTPEGRHVSSRPTMNGWTLFKEGTLQKNRTPSLRPRRPMKGMKKAAKLQARSAANS